MKKPAKTKEPLKGSRPARTKRPPKASKPARPQKPTDLVEAISDQEWADLCGVVLGEVDPDVALTRWQESALAQREEDLKSGVAWHPAVRDADVPVAKKQTVPTLQAKIQRDVASWFVQSNNQFIKVDNGSMRYGYAEMEKLLPQLIAEHYNNHPLIMKDVNKIAFAALQSKSPDPRMSFGIYSGKSYPLPGNSAKRLWRDGLWDINLWHEPAYRRLAPSGEPSAGSCAFQAMLEFAIPDPTQRNHLLDWVSWCLQNEGQKPTWSILLYSEEKGTGKSTIGEVLEALFGADNTSAVNGIRSLTQRFAADVLSKKLIVAEEVHISSYSDEGNALKDIITNDRVTVEPKYQAAVTIPQKSCFLFTTNHKPLWLEGGERRYYVIEVSHDGGALGPKSDDFSALVGRVKAEIADPQKLRDLYARLMSRTQGATFNAKNLRFADNATPIMRELQATSGNEGDEVLQALLSEYCVEIIPSADFPELINFLKSRNANALRNALARLGWEERRLRLNSKQVRTWAKKGLEIESRRISSSLLAAEYKPDAVTLGYTWFDLDFYFEKTWVHLLQDRLKRSSKSDHTASGTSANESDNPDGKYGPFNGPKSHLRYQSVIYEREALASRAQELPPTANSENPDDDLDVTSRDALAEQTELDVISAAKTVCESRNWETLGISADDWWPQTFLHHRRELADKIQAYILAARDGANGCLEMGKNENPQRIFWRGHRQKVYQLIAWALAGDIPRHGLVVRHTCDNRLCIHPQHLEVGTQSANLVDQRRTGARRRQ